MILGPLPALRSLATARRAEKTNTNQTTPRDVRINVQLFVRCDMIAIASMKRAPQECHRLRGSDLNQRSNQWPSAALVERWRQKGFFGKRAQCAALSNNDQPKAR